MLNSVTTMSGLMMRSSSMPCFASAGATLPKGTAWLMNSSGTFDAVLLAVQERQPARLRLVDHRELDAIHHRQAAALQLRRDRLRARVVGGRAGVVQLFAEVRVALEHHERRALPLGQDERSRADRVRHHVVAVHLHHFARDRAEDTAVGKVVDEARLGLGQRDLEGVPVERPQAFDFAARSRTGRWPAPACAGRPGRAASSWRASSKRALPARVVDPLGRVDVVVRRQLALLSLERRIVLEEDAGPDPHGERAEVARDLRHRGRGAGTQFGGPRKEVVLQRRLDDVGNDVVRVQVGDLRRVESGLRGVEGPAEGALALGRAHGRQAGRGGRRERRGRLQEVPAAHWNVDHWPTRAARSCGSPRLRRGVDVDVLPPGVPVRRPAIAVQPRVREVRVDPVHVVLVGLVRRA